MDTSEDKTKDAVSAPEKICALIGLRRRYFDTREEAIAALNKYTERITAKPKKKS